MLHAGFQTGDRMNWASLVIENIFQLSNEVGEESPDKSILYNNNYYSRIFSL